MRPRSRAWASLITLLKSGMRQTSHNSATASGPTARGAMSPSRARAARACSSSASRTRVRPARRGAGPGCAGAPPGRPNSRRGLRHDRVFKGVEGVGLDALGHIPFQRTHFGGGAEGGRRSCGARRARRSGPAPAASAPSDGGRRTSGCRRRHVVHVHVEPHADGVRWPPGSPPRRPGTWPPWALRVRGLSDPSTTAAPPRWRRTSSARSRRRRRRRRPRRCAGPAG